MKFIDYQKETNKTAIYKDEVFSIVDMEDRSINNTLLNLSYIGLGLGEVGEIQNKLKKIIRDKKGIIDKETKEDLLKEAGDLLYYLAQLVDFIGGDFSEVAEDNLSKLFSRLERNVIQGSGDNR